MSNRKVKVASIQMNCEMGNKKANLERAYQLMREAAERGAKISVLPELFNTAYRVEDQDASLAETIPGETSDWLIVRAQEFNMTIIACILEKENNQIYDTSLVVDKEGLKGKYQKIHLWDQEVKRFVSGEKYPVFKLEWATMGMQICYEVGFPEGARILALKGADLIIYPSAFGEERYYAWDIATKARALENGCYVIAANRTGIEKGETIFGGHSRILDPKGIILAEATKENEVIVTEIDMNKVSEQRKTIPYLRDLNNEIVIRELKNLNENKSNGVLHKL
ncbi:MULTISPECIES: carbon-nitrogen hydrolase family protein [Peribacillus]|uniref:carbon-nitrogen hydrolase family protein n=1 Tax=Peribacillus TaxID=2675229 RepID=UPI00296FF559|nr:MULTISPECIES: carbon-nitrogen hydrolase family protein [Peribacillus]MEA3575334.1 carbon-nitrogen hydrolase family protein [Peribacillus frigoritolerans]